MLHTAVTAALIGTVRTRGCLITTPPASLTAFYLFGIILDIDSPAELSVVGALVENRLHMNMGRGGGIEPGRENAGELVRKRVLLWGEDAWWLVCARVVVGTREFEEGGAS